jgi:hypothetical protein
MFHLLSKFVGRPRFRQKEGTTISTTRQVQPFARTAGRPFGQPQSTEFAKAKQRCSHVQGTYSVSRLGIINRFAAADWIPQEFRNSQLFPYRLVNGVGTEYLFPLNPILETQETQGRERVKKLAAGGVTLYRLRA